MLAALSLSHKRRRRGGRAMLDIAHIVSALCLDSLLDFDPHYQRMSVNFSENFDIE